MRVSNMKASMWSCFTGFSSAVLKPHKIDNTMAFMFESRYAMRLTRFAMESSQLQNDYFEGWQGLKKLFGKR